LPEQQHGGEPVPVRILVLLLAGAVAALSASPAAAAPTKPIRMDVESPEWAGFTDASYTVTLTNETKTQQLGSADITVPSQLTIVDRNGIGGSGNVLQLRSLELAPGESVTVTLGLRMPCVSGGYPWGIEAKQSNDFSGPPGNALGPVSGNRATTVQGSCKLRFVDQPASSERSAQIRADAFQPASAHLVTVEAIDGSPAPQRLEWFTGAVDLRLVQSGPGALTPSPASSAAVAGLASFSDMAVDQSGNYNLRATTTAAGFTAGDSATFQVIGVVERCRPAQCRAELAGADTTSTLLGTPAAGDGFALLSLNLGPAPVCAGYTSPSSDYYEFGLSGVAADKTIVAGYGKQAVRRAGGQSKLEICFAAPHAFAAKTGPAVQFDYDGDPGNGAEGFVGLLPDCPATPSEPCVDDRASTPGGGAEVLFFVPAAWGDPRYN
jgi:hypothetical protein